MSSRHFKIFSSKMVTMLKVSSVLLFGTFVTLVSCTLFSANFTPSKVITALQEYYEYIPDIVENNLLLPWKWGSEMDAAQKWSQAEKIFETEMRQLQLEYPNQKLETWIQLKATITATLKESEPVHPAVILALLPPSMQYKFGSCFARQIATLVNKAVHPVLNSSATQTSDIPEPVVLSQITFELSDITSVRSKLEAYLKSRGKSILVENVDKFTNADHLMVFHGICDNFHAVDRRATVLFPVNVPVEIYEKCRTWDHNMGGQISNDVLTSAWKHVLPENALPALIARVADAVILVETGDSCKMNGITISSKQETTSTSVKPSMKPLESSNKNRTSTKEQAKLVSECATKADITKVKASCDNNTQALQAQIIILNARVSMLENAGVSQTQKPDSKSETNLPPKTTNTVTPTKSTGNVKTSNLNPETAPKSNSHTAGIPNQSHLPKTASTRKETKPVPEIAPKSNPQTERTQEPLKKTSTTKKPNPPPETASDLNPESASIPKQSKPNKKTNGKPSNPSSKSTIPPLAKPQQVKNSKTEKSTRTSINKEEGQRKQNDKKKKHTQIKSGKRNGNQKKKEKRNKSGTRRR